MAWGMNHLVAALRGPSPLDSLKGDDELSPRRITVREELDSHVMVENVPPAVVAEIEGRGTLYPGVSIIERNRRFYPRGNLAAHVLGYLGMPSRTELETEADKSYHAEDRRGRAGLELRYEKFLHGRHSRPTDWCPWLRSVATLHAVPLLRLRP